MNRLSSSAQASPAVGWHHLIGVDTRNIFSYNMLHRGIMILNVVPRCCDLGTPTATVGIAGNAAEQ